MMRFDEKQTRTALGIASCSSAGFRRNMGTMAKGLHSGLAARAGIEAAELARAGFTADESILEAPLGFIAAVCGPGEYDVPSLHQALGQPFLLEKGPNIKAYPACVPGHSLIEMGIKISPRIANRLDDIELVEADLHGFSLMRPEAEDEDAAGFSGAYLLAAGLVHGAFDLSHITAEAVQDPRVRKLMGKVRHRPAVQKGIERIDIKMRSGEIVSDEGSERPRRLTTDEEIDGKFIACCDGVIGTQSARELLKRLRELENEQTLDRIMDIARG
jgi:2-methylcitrate dehydratase PrpD